MTSFSSDRSYARWHYIRFSSNTFKVFHSNKLDHDRVGVIANTAHHTFNTRATSNIIFERSRIPTMKLLANALLLAAAATAAAIPTPASEADIDALRAQGLCEVSCRSKGNPPHIHLVQILSTQSP